MNEVTLNHPSSSASFDLVFSILGDRKVIILFSDTNLVMCWFENDHSTQLRQSQPLTIDPSSPRMQVSDDVTNWTFVRSSKGVLVLNLI